MPVRDKVRASGKTGATEAAEKVTSEDLLEQMTNELPEQRERTVAALSFSRMKTDWSGENRIQMAHIQNLIDGQMLREFADAYAIMNDLFDIVRQPVVDTETGEILVDLHGFRVWKRSPTGSYIEDWSQLSYRHKEDFLFRITTQIFGWEQKKADMWGESLLAKAIFTEEHAIEYGASMSGTIEDRTAAANRRAAEARYFAVYKATASRKADGIVRSLELLSQRLKDTLGG